MQTSLETVDKHRVKLSVEVPSEETTPVLDLAYHSGGINFSDYTDERPMYANDWFINKKQPWPTLTGPLREEREPGGSLSVFPIVPARYFSSAL